MLQCCRGYLSVQHGAVVHVVVDEGGGAYHPGLGDHPVQREHQRGQLLEQQEERGRGDREMDRRTKERERKEERQKEEGIKGRSQEGIEGNKNIYKRRKEKKRLTESVRERALPWSVWPGPCVG